MIDLDKAAEGIARTFPEKDYELIRATVESLVAGVRAEPPGPGDFHFQSTYGITVEQHHFEEDGLGPLVVYAEVASDYDHGDLA